MADKHTPLLARAATWLLSTAAAACIAGPVEVRVTGANGQPLAGAVVFLESREAKALAKPLVNVEVEQAQRQFQPAVSVVTVGTSVTFPNRDTVRHQVYSFSAAKRFELKLYVGTPAAPVVFDQTGIAVLGCNIHDQMTAWIVIVETPYFGRTGADGKLLLPNVPAGSYRLRTWHPGLPVGDVPADQVLRVDAVLVAASVALAKVAL